MNNVDKYEEDSMVNVGFKTGRISVYFNNTM